MQSEKLLRDLHEELVEADRVICDLCKRLNPQHVTMDNGKGCEWCQERDSRRRTIREAAAALSSLQKKGL